MLASPSFGRDMDPLLKDLAEKKKSFRKNVVSMAVDLQEARIRLASREETLAKETLWREETEKRAKRMEEEICRLHETLDENNGTEQLSQELDDLRSQLSATRVIANASTSKAQSTEFKCLEFSNVLHENSYLLKQCENRMSKLEETLVILEKDLQVRETSQNHLKDKVLQIERDIMEAVAIARTRNDHQLLKISDEVSHEISEKTSKLLMTKDEEIAKLRDKIGIMSSHWKHKAKELELQSGKQEKADQDLQKRVLKLEFCILEARAQTRKLQRTGDRRDKALKELKDYVAKLQECGKGDSEKHNFWESNCFQIVTCLTMLALVIFSKQ